ncbi:MAG: biotin--[acetyl-CoA-carboxylase] ligase [Spirochaetes bacterium]|nr:biotin--[acetyl-CoA-carboxylase] ligase [Spirochaetota bacterium]
MFTYHSETLTAGTPVDVVVVDSVDSTNTYAKTMPLAKAALVLAYEQTGGYGRFKRPWRSARGDIMMTLALPAPALRGDTLLSLYTGYCLVKAIEQYVSAGVSIKYPNDIYIGDAKLAGILIESLYSAAGAIERMVIGIGINVSGDAIAPDSGFAATSLAAHGYNGDVNELINGFIKMFFRYQAYLSGETALFIELMRPYHRLYGTKRRFVHEGKEMTGVIKEITETGALMITFPDGVTRPVSNVTFSSQQT